MALPSQPRLLLQTGAVSPCQACPVPLPSGPAFTPFAQALPRSQPLTDGHLAIALEADTLVLVTVNLSRLLRGAVLRVDPQAGVALQAAESRRVGRWQESVDAHSGNGCEVRSCGLRTASGRPPGLTDVKV